MEHVKDEITIDEGGNLEGVYVAEGQIVLATRDDVKRVEDKLDTLIGIFSELGETMEGVFNGGGMGSIVKGLMGRD